MKKPDINRVIDLQKLLLQFQVIDRALYVPGQNSRRENDTEHSYNLAMIAWFLVRYFPELDRDEVIHLALVHDLVEVHAGDTFPFHNTHHVATKKDREDAALEKLSQEWPDFSDMTDHIRRYEERDTPEARFVYALDKVIPAIINLLQGGQAWHEHNVTFTEIRQVKDDKVALSPEIEPYYHELLTILKDNPQLFGEPSNNTA
jgi:putative hydrolases of HD superfamily